MYEFALDRAWYGVSTDVSKWIREYTHNRYGIENEHIQNAWNILKVNWFLTRVIVWNKVNHRRAINLMKFYSINVIRIRFIHMMDHRTTEITLFVGDHR